MRTIQTKIITEAVAQLVCDAALKVRPDVLAALQTAQEGEKTKRAKETLGIIIENALLAKRDAIPICQDTGMAIVYCEIGRDVIIEGNIDEAINKGVAQGTKKGFLRRSIVGDPVERNNTGTNTPASIHYSWRNGSKIKISVLLKGFGCENKGQVVMLNPTAGVDDIRREVVRIIKEAGANACPPYVIGVGIGGTMDVACEIAKKALLAPIGKRNKKSWCASLEISIINDANKLGIGPLGFGGTKTVLDVKVKDTPTHIAGLPVAVNVSCHALRSKSVLL